LWSVTPLCNVPEINKNGAPTGYTLTNTYAATSATYGSTVQVQVTKAATSKVSFKVVGSSTTAPVALTAADLAANAFPSLTAAEKSAFTGKTTDNIDISTADVFASGKLNKLVGKTLTDKDGNQTHNVYTFSAADTKSGNATVVFGSPVTAYYTVESVKGAAPTTATDTGNTDYLG